VGDEVIVAWLRKDERSVDVYRLNGEFMCTAVPHESLEREDVVAIKRRERERQALQNKRLRRAISQSLEAYSPANTPGGLEVATLSAASAPRRSAEADGEEETLLNALGLTGRIGTAWSPEKGQNT